MMIIGHDDAIEGYFNMIIVVDSYRFLIGCFLGSFRWQLSCCAGAY